jgi:hypothetical protein
MPSHFRNRASAKITPGRKGSRRRRFAPYFEPLEDRTLLSTNVLVHYDGPKSLSQLNGNYYVIDFKVNNQQEEFTVGLMPVFLSNADGSNVQPEFQTLCVDAFDDITAPDLSHSNSFLATPAAANTGLPNGGEIAYLYNHYGYFPTSGFAYTTPDGYKTSNYPLAEAAGLQLAIWELQYGLTDASFSPNTTYTSQAKLNTALKYADQFVAEAQGKSENAVWLHATHSGYTNPNLGQDILAPTPTITTQTGGPVVVGSGAKLTDSATLSGGLNPTGSITFTLYDPNNNVVDTEVVNSVNGDGTYTTPNGYVPTMAGTYQWVASYGGNNFNLPVSSNKGDEPEVVSPASPGITTTPSPTSVTLGTSSVTLKDTADLEGGYSPTGSITFTLVAPGGATVDTETVSVSGNGKYTTPTGYTLPTSSTVTGTYQWNAVFTDSSGNNANASDLNDKSEQVAVSPASPGITTTPGQTSTTTGTGTFATIGFWHNKNGQAVITNFDTGANSKLLGNSLASSYQNLFGYANPYTSVTLGASAGAAPGLAGLTNSQVAAVYLGLWKPSGVVKNTYVQAFAVALGLYASGGQGAFNVGSNGAAFNVANNSTLPITQILQAVSSNFNPTTGLFHGGDQTLTSQANNVLDGINTSGETPGGITVVSSSTKLTDSATLSGGYYEGGTITFYLMGPGATAQTPLSQAVYTDVVQVSGNRVYTTAMGNKPGGYQPTATGTYQWVAVYSGDGNNNTVTSPFGSEPWTVGTQTPVITTTPNMTAVTLGTTTVTLKDTATLQDGVNPGGSITFTLVAPDGKTVLDTETVKVNGNGNYTTPTGYSLPTNTNVTGTYQWNASYSGDGTNAPDSDTNDPAERTVVSPASPSITTTPSPASVSMGASSVTLKDSAQLSGGYSPTGSITFTLVAPDGMTVLDTETVTITGNGTYTTPTGYTLPAGTTATGTYQWNASFADTSGNNLNASDLNDTAEQVTVGTASGHPVGKGDFATIGFWHNKNGQALINSLNGGSTSTALAQWLATTFPNLYGPTAGIYSMVNGNGTYFTNAQVAASYNANFFTTGTGAKTNAQILAGALAAYATSTNMAGGTFAKGYGFNTSSGGTGLDTINVGSNGAAFGVPNNSTVSVLQLLQGVNAQAKNGVLYSGNANQASLSNAANNVFDTQVNSAGDISLVTESSTSAAGSAPLVDAVLGLPPGVRLVYVDNSQGNVTADEQARIDDAVATYNNDLASVGISLVEVGADQADNADITIELSDTSDIGGVAQGVLGLTEMGGQVTLVTGWNYYFGTDPSAIGADQYDFQTVATHELGHAIGLGHSTDGDSVMYPYLGSGAVRRDLTAGDLTTIDQDASGQPEPLLALPAAKAPRGEEAGQAPVSPAAASSPAAQSVEGMVTVGASRIVTALGQDSALSAAGGAAWGRFLQSRVSISPTAASPSGAAPGYRTELATASTLAAPPADGSVAGRVEESVRTDAGTGLVGAPAARQAALLAVLEELAGSPSLARPTDSQPRTIESPAASEGQDAVAPDGISQDGPTAAGKDSAWLLFLQKGYDSFQDEDAAAGGSVLSLAGAAFLVGSALPRIVELKDESRGTGRRSPRRNGRHG